MRSNTYTCICIRASATFKRKGSDLTQSYDKSPLHPRKNPKTNVKTQKTPPKTSITQQLRIDLGRSVGVAVAIQLVWFNRFTSVQTSNLPQHPVNQKDTNMIKCFRTFLMYSKLIYKQYRIQKHENYTSCMINYIFSKENSKEITRKCGQNMVKTKKSYRHQAFQFEMKPKNTTLRPTFF